MSFHPNSPLTRRLDDLEKDLSRKFEVRIRALETRIITLELDAGPTALDARGETPQEEPLRVGKSEPRVHGFTPANDDLFATDGPIAFRNKNPGNLRPTPAGKSRWIGEVDTTNGYAQFVSNLHGVRALAYLLRISYFRRHQLTTIREILDRYAPLGDNAVDSHENYEAALASDLGVMSTDRIDLEDDAVLQTLMVGISQFESGERWTALTGTAGLKTFSAALALVPA